MRTLIFLAIGVGLWVATAYFYKWTGMQSDNRWLPVLIFGLLWFTVAGWNMWVGVTSAGYSFLQEMPIFLLIFLVPFGTAVLTTYKFRL